MAAPPLPPKLPGPLHVLSKWSLALTLLAVLFFVSGFVWAAASPKHASDGWRGDVWMLMIFILAPLAVLGAGVTGIMGAMRRKHCLAIGIAVVPVLVVVLMFLFLWAALLGASRFR